ncbi:MAG: phosphohydrolase [Eubacteriales bacterium]|nr:phosphohydrolase [Eubacteriales bacterium]
MADYITTYSKVHFTPMEPKAEEILISDIAHPLSLLTRANGHFPQFYSVGQHSIQCAREAAARGYSDRLVLACLIHDASEAYLSDITRPVKKNLPGYRSAERVLQDAIYRKFLGSLPDEKEAALIKHVDDTCLYYEFYHFAGEKLFECPGEMLSQADFSLRPFIDVEEEFTELFERYSASVRKL